MTPQELVQMCVNAINQPCDIPALKDLPPMVMIQMPETKREPRKRWIGIPGNSPIGEVLQRLDGYDVVAFRAVDVLAWLAANGVVKVEQGPHYADEGVILPTDID